MVELTSELSAQLILLSTVVTIAIEVIKRTQLVPEPERWIPLLSVTLATLIGVFILRTDLLLSALAGAASCGLYDLSKRTLAGRT